MLLNFKSMRWNWNQRIHKKSCLWSRSYRSSNEEQFADIFEEIPDVNIPVPKAEDKFKTFTWSKVPCKTENATEEEVKRYESREALTEANVASHFWVFINRATNILNYGLKIIITKACISSTALWIKRKRLSGVIYYHSRNLLCHPTSKQLFQK